MKHSCITPENLEIFHFWRCELVESKLTLTFTFDIHLKWCSTTNCSSNLLLRLLSLHLRRRAIQALTLPFCLAIKYCLVLLRRFSGNACIFTGLLTIEFCLMLLWCPSGDACTLTGSCCNHLCSYVVPPATLALSRGPIDNQATIIVGPPLLSGCHHCWAAIVVGLPLLLGCHCFPTP
jgi:hypothetical protein